ncbi:MAG: DNA polymerase III subunit beta [Lentisphaerae bacterium]|nr:DNA polymerase III subunit beta [Lentisphaerota bacterium]
MKFSITRSKLLECLQKVQNVTSSKNTLQILSNAMIKAEEGKLFITTTDLDMSVRSSVEADITVPGATTLPVRRLAGIVKELPEGVISFEIDDKDTAAITCGASSYRIHGLPVSDFPPIPEAEGSKCYRLDQGAFREMLRKTTYAASLDETRPVLNGALLAFKEGKLTTVATDGRRLALVEHEVEFPQENDIELILPTKAVNGLTHILGNDGDLRVFAQKNQLVFEFEDTMMCTKLIDGVYPNYRQVIPSGCEERVTIERELLLSALRRVSTIADNKSNSAKLTFSENQLEIISNSPDIGEGRELLPIKYAGKTISAIFNPEYIMDPLRNLDSDNVIFELNDGNSPALLKCDIPFLYVLMPLRF